VAQLYSRCYELHGLPLRGLTFELSGRQRQAARARPQIMYSVPVAGPWWPAVGAPLERGVRPQFCSVICGVSELQVHSYSAGCATPQDSQTPPYWRISSETFV
jgi:hypothetical protein